ncbi:MAG: hypothetical protein Q9209_003520 [Squamulea sp. 1 TL-2023]
MGSTGVALGVHLREDEAFQPRKRFKACELPLSATQRSTIDELLHTIKKKGEYDTLRKKVWSAFVDSDEKKDFTNRLNELANAEIDRDPSFLSRDRGKAATLMQGAVDRSDIYRSVEQSIDRLVSEHLNHVLAAGREIRKAEIGEEAAAEEERRGNITDEEYAKEAAVRRVAREQQRHQDETRRRREEEKEKVRADFAKKEAELQRLKKREEERLEREAIKQRQKEALRKREEERSERFKENEGRGRSGGDDTPAPSQRTQERSRSRRRSTERVDQSRNVSTHIAHDAKLEDAAALSTATPHIDEAEVEREALEKLLREGAELAAKSSTKQHPDRSDSVEPPHRRPHMLKPKPSSTSPLKAVESRSPMRSASIKPVLSFSSINAKPSEPPAVQQFRNKSPPSAPRSQIQFRSLSNHYTQRIDDRRGSQAPDNRAPPDHVTTPQQVQATTLNERDMREASGRSQTPARDDTREKEKSRSHYREESYDGLDRRRIRQREYDEVERKMSRHDRPRSRGPRDVGKDDNRVHNHDRGERDRRQDRSRSPYTVSDTKYHYDEKKDAKETNIDRYKPHRDSYNGYKEKARYGHRDESVDSRDRRDLHEDRDKERRRKDDGSYRDRRDDRDRERLRREDDRYRERDRERGRDGKEDTRYRDKRDDGDRGRERALNDKEDARYRERHDDRKSRAPDDRDDERYRPEHNSERDRKEPNRDREDDRDRDRDTRDDRRDRGRDRDRDRDARDERQDRDRDRDSNRRSDRRDRADYKDARDEGRNYRDRDKDRKDDGRDRDRDRGSGIRSYGSIDRYMPSSSRDDQKRARERDRDR